MIYALSLSEFEKRQKRRSASRQPYKQKQKQRKKEIFFSVKRKKLHVILVGFVFFFFLVLNVESFKMSEIDVISADSAQEYDDADKYVIEILNQILDEASTLVEMKIYRAESAKMYDELFLKALNEVYNVYNLPQPCNDHSHIIDAWKRDIPAKPSIPDNLNSKKFFFNQNQI